MKKYTRYLLLSLVLSCLFVTTKAFANECREWKLVCKEYYKLDGEYTPLERQTCRDVKLECKAQ